MFKQIDCVELYVNDLDQAIEFYRDRLGHKLVWRSETAAGLQFPQSEGELVVQTERPGMHIDLLVASADAASKEFVKVGGSLLAGPFDIQIGRCAVVIDPWGNRLVLLDMSKGRLITDPNGNITGNEAPSLD